MWIRKAHPGGLRSKKLSAYLLGALILIEPAVALLPLLHDLISAECPVAFLRRMTVNINFGVYRQIAHGATSVLFITALPTEQKLTREELADCSSKTRKESTVTTADGEKSLRDPTWHCVAAGLVSIWIRIQNGALIQTLKMEFYISSFSFKILRKKNKAYFQKVLTNQTQIIMLICKR
jgi:hypothetical protein